MRTQKSSNDQKFTKSRKDTLLFAQLAVCEWLSAPLLPFEAFNLELPKLKGSCILDTMVTTNNGNNKD